MSTQRYERVPQFTQGDRLRKARSLTGLNTRDFAEQIGVSHGSVTNAEGDKVTVRKITLNAWALATGVPVEWLEHGTTGDSPPRPDPSVKRSAEGHGEDDVSAVRRTRKYSLTALAPVA